MHKPRDARAAGAMIAGCAGARPAQRVGLHAVKLPVPVCRGLYRSAYTVLRGYWFLRRPDVEGVKCVLTNGDLVLLVRHTYGHREWDLPGGKVRPSEPPRTTATREMEEELGVVIETWQELGTVQARIDHRRDNMHLFQAELGSRQIKMDPCELATVRWFPRAGLPPELGRFVSRILAAAAEPEH